MVSIVREIFNCSGGKHRDVVGLVWKRVQVVFDAGSVSCAEAEW